MTGIERAKELAEEIQGHLDDAALGESATAVFDMNRTPRIVSAGQSCVAVLPPKQQFPTIAHTTNEWVLLVVAGPVDNHLAAWEKIDAIIQALKDPLNIAEAEPAEYQLPGGAAYPAYTLTFSETI